MSRTLVELTPLVKWAARRFGGGLDRDEALSQAWWHAHLAVESYKPGARSLDSWVVLNVKWGVYALKRQAARRAAVIATSTDVVEASGAPANDPFALESLEVLYPRQRQAVELVFRQGLTKAEAAKAMGVAEPTVWNMIAQARRRLLEAA